MEDRLIRLPEVLKIYPVSRSTWLAGVAAGKYPAKVKMSMRCTAWRLSEVLALIDDPTTKGATQ